MLILTYSSRAFSKSLFRRPGLRFTTTAQADRVNKAWDRIEKWYSQNLPNLKMPSGASVEEIKELENHLQLTLPDSLKSSLYRYNGLRSNLWPYGDLLSAKEIKSDWDTWVKLYPPEEQVERKSNKHHVYKKWDEKVRRYIWYSKWISIDSDGCGNQWVLDLDPSSKGVVGQMFLLDHEVGIEVPLLPDFESYLEMVAREMEEGKYMIEDGQIMYKY